jgi:hypothetical protein
VSAEREKLVLQEVTARAEARLAVDGLVRAIRGELYDRQQVIFDDKSRRVGVLGTRRAGKTEIWSRRAVCTALERPRSIIRIWAINKLRCKELMWNSITLLCQRHKIPLQGNETTGTFKLPNGSEIRLLGADKEKEAQKKRGDKTAAEIVLESQMYSGFLKALVEDVAGPCLFDLQGTFYLEGTPGLVCGGYWYDVSGREDHATRWESPGGDGGVGAGWAMHHLNILANPFIAHRFEELASLKKMMRWKDTNPTYVREWLGRWVNDFDALYYAFDPVRNTFSPELGIQPWGPGWMHTLGWDLGGKDDMALTVWGFHPSLPELYEAFSWKKPGASADEVIEQVKGLEARKFNLIKMVADTGGGGKMYVEEVQRRYPYSFEPAKKSEKYEHVRLLNDDLRGGFLKLMAGSAYAGEIAVLPKKQPWPNPEDPEALPEEHPLFANHCCDAGLYSYRGAMHYLHREAPPVVKPQTPEWFAREERRIIETLEAKRKNEAEPWLNRYDRPDEGLSDPFSDDDSY